MDKEQNAIPSSESSEAELISNDVEEINEPITTDTENDCRINCTDKQSLRNILDITLNEIEDLADSCNLKDSRTDFVSLFGEISFPHGPYNLYSKFHRYWSTRSFKNALQENILVNGLPLIIDESKTLSSSEKEENSQMIDDVLFGKLSKKVGNVAQERKFYPEQCCRIFNIEMKHELQNLKKAKVTDPSLPSTSLQSSIKSSDRTQLKNFSDFCQGFGTMQETVQCKIQEEEKMAMKLSLVNEIHKKQKLS